MTQAMIQKRSGRRKKVNKNVKGMTRPRMTSKLLRKRLKD
jgi:hypothetical protein